MNLRDLGRDAVGPVRGRVPSERALRPWQCCAWRLRWRHPLHRRRAFLGYVLGERGQADVRGQRGYLPLGPRQAEAQRRLLETL